MLKPNTLRGWLVPYRQIGRDAVYELSDLDRFIDARLVAADVRLAGRPDNLAPPNPNPPLRPTNLASFRKGAPAGRKNPPKKLRPEATLRTSLPVSQLHGR